MDPINKIRQRVGWGEEGWFKYEQRQHKYKTDNALKKSDFPAWEKQKRAEMEKIIKSGKTE